VRYGHRWDGDGLTEQLALRKIRTSATWNVGKVELSVVNLLRFAAVLGLDAPKGSRGWHSTWVTSRCVKTPHGSEGRSAALGAGPSEAGGG
jgi:hypothetical protein